MKKGTFAKLLPHIIAIVIFLIVAVIFCKPVLEGKVVNQHDVLGWKGMAQQSFEYREQHGHYPLWTNSLFSGMPAYTIAMEPNHSLQTIYLYEALNLWLPKPMNFFFLACICFYFLCIVLRINPWIGIMAALAYAYASYDPVIIAVGHDTKMRAMALAPAVIGSLLLILRRNYLWGAALLSLFFGFQVATQHLQIVYYTALIIGFLVLSFLVFHWKKEKPGSLLTSLGVAIGAAIIGFFSYSVVILPLREFAKETMRGGRSELTQAAASGQSKEGLSKDYAFNWSYGIDETFSLIVPGIYGGSNGGHEFKGTTAFTEKMTEAGVPEEQALQMANSYAYWGEQPGTSGTVYLGAIICFLFILGMVFIDSWHKWWIIAATIFGILLAWGKNFAAFNYFLFDYLPLYNKFRAPTMALIIPQLTFPLAAALGLQQILFDNQNSERLWKKFKTSVFITGGVVAILFVLYISFDYSGSNDTQIQENFTNAMLSQAGQGGQVAPQVQQQAQAFGQSIIKALREDRQSHFGGDLLRSLLFIVLAVVLIGAYLKNKVKAMTAIIGLALLSTIDLLGIGWRYLNESAYVDADQFEAGFIPTAADQQILADPAKPFRVFDQTDQQGPFNSSRASYFHNSIGGYNPAKLGLYQDLIEHQISKGNVEVFNMLNTKYIISQNPTNGQAIAQQNPGAFGPVWLVKGVKLVANADAEMAALDNTPLKDTVVIQQQYAQQIQLQPIGDTAATIQLKEYDNDKLVYTFNGNSNQFAVFSEVYYPLGWNAYIDGKRVNYAKVNYVLRGLPVPAGQHTIEFRFEPETYKLSNILMLAATIITLLLLAAAIFFEVKKRKSDVVTTTT